MEGVETVLSRQVPVAPSGVHPGTEVHDEADDE
jgi:hypothetical protein